MRRPARLLAAAAVLVVALSGCGADDSAASPPEPEAEPIRVGVVGDSLADGDATDAIPADPGSFTQYLDDRFEVAAGWRRSGATSRMMADNLQPFTADALVVMAGTNDPGRGLDVDDTLDAIGRIVAKADVRVVVLCAIPPSRSRPRHPVELDAALATLADRSGWVFIDPWRDVRDGEEWAPGATTDGIHGTLTSYARAAIAIGDAVESALRNLGGPARTVGFSP